MHLAGRSLAAAAAAVALVRCVYTHCMPQLSTVDVAYSASMQHQRKEKKEDAQSDRACTLILQLLACNDASAHRAHYCGE